MEGGCKSLINKTMEHDIKKTEHEMGSNTSEIFAGQVKSKATEKMYAESADYFAHIIRNMLPQSDKQYTLLDAGSYKGELLGQVLDRLKDDYKFYPVGVDSNPEALSKNKIAKERTLSSLNVLPFRDHSFDLAIMRYALQWNTADEQKAIIKELSRVISHFAIIQHPGSNPTDPETWRSRTDDLFDGKEIKKLERTDYYFASRDEIENWMKDMGIKFQRLQDRRIDNGSDIYTERFGLDAKETAKMKEILGDQDCFEQTTWIIYPDKVESGE